MSSSFDQLQLTLNEQEIKCEKCNNKTFKEIIDDHCQIFKCSKCGALIVFGNHAMVERKPAEIS